MGCCNHNHDHKHEHKIEDQKAGSCCGGGHKHEHAKPETSMKWWQKLLPGLSKKSCCGGKDHCH